MLIPIRRCEGASAAVRAAVSLAAFAVALACVIFPAEAYGEEGDPSVVVSYSFNGQGGVANEAYATWDKDRETFNVRVNASDGAVDLVGGQWEVSVGGSDITSECAYTHGDGLVHVPAIYAGEDVRIDVLLDAGQSAAEFEAGIYVATGPTFSEREALKVSADQTEIEIEMKGCEPSAVLIDSYAVDEDDWTVEGGILTLSGHTALSGSITVLAHVVPEDALTRSGLRPEPASALFRAPGSFTATGWIYCLNQGPGEWDYTDYTLSWDGNLAYVYCCEHGVYHHPITEGDGGNVTFTATWTGSTTTSSWTTQDASTTYYWEHRVNNYDIYIDFGVYQDVSGSWSGYGEDVLVRSEPRLGGINLAKHSSRPEITDGNACYTLAGAEYGVYRDEACTDLWFTQTTGQRNASGTQVEDYWETAMDIPVGTYWVREVSAPEGYALDETIYRVDVAADQSVRVGGEAVYDLPQGDPAGALLQKRDGELSDGPQGAASLALAQFTFWYYDGYYDTLEEARASGDPTATWVMQTDEDGYVSLRMGDSTFETDDGAEHPYKVSGSDFYRDADGTIMLPYGTLFAQETRAPEGYLDNPEVFRAQVAPDGSTGDTVHVYNTPVVPDGVIRGGVEIGKFDSELSELRPQGGATLEGTAFDIVNESDGSVVVDGKTIEPGQVAATIFSDADGIARTAPDTLPYGDYSIGESAPPDGYLGSTQSMRFSVREEGGVVDLTGQGIADDVIRGGMRIGKTDADLGDARPQGDATLEGTVFEIVNESANAVIVDGELHEPGSVVKAIRTDASGIAQTAPDALPYGEYLVREASAPVGYNVSDQAVAFSIGNDGEVVDLVRQGVADKVKKGDISIMKYGETQTNPDEDPTIKHPLAGVEFEVVNESAAAVVSPDGRLVDPGEVVVTIRTDSQGWASTETHRAEGESGALPFGTYLVREVASTVPDGYAEAEEFVVTVSEDGSVLRYVLEDKTGTAIRVVKTDAETGKRVSGRTSFRILDAQMQPITFTSYYPQITVQSVFTTAADGTCVLPEKLMMGTYYLQEVEAPEGYLINDQVVRFDVDSSTVNTFANPLNVEMADIPAKGVIEIEKVDAETAESVAVEGIGFSVYADEDVATADGTVRVLKDELVAKVATDAAGTARTPELYPGRYRVVETSAPEGYVVDRSPREAVVPYVDGETPVSVCRTSMPDAPQKGVIEITKVDAETGRIVPFAAKFDVVAADDVVTPDGTVRAAAGDVVATVETDERGRAETGELYLGSYDVIERSAPSGYVLDGDPTRVVLSYAGQEEAVARASATVDDMPQKGGVEIVKTDAETGRAVPCEGAVFEIVAADDIVTPDGTVRARAGEAVATARTDGFGRAEAADLYLGSYLVREVSAPRGYVLSEDEASFELSYAGQAVSVASAAVEFADVPAKGTIEFTKVDAETGRVIPVAGTCARVTAAEDIVTPDGTVRSRAGDVVAELVTDDSGRARSPELYLGAYMVTETIAVEPYVINPEPKRVTLEYADQLTPVVSAGTEIGNVSAKGVIEIAKTDAETGRAIPVAGAEFDVMAKADIVTPDGTLRAAAGEVVAEIATGGDGKARTPELYLGTYTVVERRAPEGYLLNAEEHDVEIAYEGQTVPVVLSGVEVGDAPAKGVIEVAKVDAETGLPVAAAGIGFDVYAAVDIVTPDGTVRAAKDTLVASMSTDEAGCAQTGALYLGSYYVRESRAPIGYVLSTEGVPVELEYADQVTSIVVEGAAVANAPQKGVIEVAKVDAETGRAIPAAGTAFEVVAREDVVTGDGTLRAAAGEVVAEVETDDSGVASTPELYLGSYAVYERRAPEGYVLNGEPVVANLDYAGQHVAVTSASTVVGDVPQKGVIEVAKVDAETGRAIPAAGTAFEVVAREDVVTGDGTVRARAGEVVAEIETDGGGKARTPELYLGSYAVYERRAPEGYVLNGEPVVANLDYAGQHVAVTSASTVVGDVPQKGVIEVAKVDAETGRAIPAAGTAFEVVAHSNVITPDGTVRYSGGEVVAEIETDDSGMASTPELYLGSYDVVETRAPYGYVVADPVRVDLSYAGQEVSVSSEKVRVADEPAKGTISIAKVDAETGKFIRVAGIGARVQAAEDIYTPDGTLRYSKGDVVAEVETDSTGTASTPELYLGAYEVVETLAPEGYLVNTTAHSVVLSYAGQAVPVVTAGTTMEDVAAKGVIEVAKVDAETGKAIPASGTTFEIRAAEDIVTADLTLRAAAGEVVATVETNASGIATSPELYLGSYDVVETQAPDGYVLDSTPRGVVLSYAGQEAPVVHASVVAGNRPAMGVVELTKSDLETGLPVKASAEYEVVAAEDVVTPDGTLRVAKGETADRIVIGEDGKGFSKPLYLGAYDVVETKAPEGYMIDADPHRVSLLYDGQDVPVSYLSMECRDAPQKGAIEITKTDAETGEPVEGSVYEVVAAENIVTGDGTVREQQGDVVAVLETGPDGTAAAEGLYLGSYDVVESSQTDGYVLDPERHRVVLEYAGQEVAVSEARLDVVNVPNRLVVDKTDSEGNELSGVGFAWWPAASEVGLPRSDGAGAVGVAVPENEDGDVVAIRVIGENGDEKDLACEDGVWTALAPFGACSIRAELSEGGVLLAEVELSEDSPEAAFEVREGELVRVPALTRCGVSEGMTSEDGSLRIERLGPGAWVIAEVAPLPGYVPDPAPRVVEVAPDGTVSGSAEAVLGFVNDKTQVLFSKIDSETGRELSGAVLQIVDGQGRVVEEWTSGSDPHAVKGLPVGEYVFRETQAPDGYLVAEDVVFEVRGIAEAQEVSMIDERVPEFEEAAPAEPFDKTGDWLLAHWRSAAGMLLMGGSSVAAGLRLAGRRRTAGR